MMKWFFASMLIIGVVLCVVDGDGEGLLRYMLEGADNAVTLSLSLAGSYLLWMGLMNIARCAGLVDALARIMRKPLGLLIRDADSALAPVTLNLAANFFGLGNAATPFGLEAMKQFQRFNMSPGVATDGMCMFIALNASAIELLPTSVIAVRAAAGSAEPYSIVLPTLISSVISAAVAIVLCKFFEKLGRIWR